MYFLQAQTLICFKLDLISDAPFSIKLPILVNLCNKFKEARCVMNAVSMIFLSYTLSNKKTHLPYSIRMQWKNIWLHAVHVKQNIFEQKMNKICSL